MKVQSITFQNFRNLKDGCIEPCDGVNVIYGDNAQGKTNLIEALWLFCGGHSFRTASYREMVRFDSDSARLSCTFFGQERLQRAELLFASGKKKVTVNGVEQKTSSALIEKFCAVVFSPENLSLIKRGPGERRNFIDSALCREKLRNALLLTRYNNILSQRNALLKDVGKKPQLEKTIDIWDAQMVTLGAQLVKKRLEYAAMISEKAAVFHRGISKDKEQLQLRYVSSFGASPDDSIAQLEQKFIQKCADNRASEISYGVTLSGPHRDDVEIVINGKNARSFASQGQQRSAVLSLKLAEAAVLRERMGENPVVLLDDVMSELDNSRQDYLFNELSDCQVFITCCEQSGREQLRKGKIFLVKDGEVVLEKE